MSTWAGVAHMLADDIREPGYGAAAVCSSAWRARVDPQATHGLVGAAMALLGNDALVSLRAEVPPCPDDTTLLHQVSNLEGTAGEFLAHCRKIAERCQAEREAAIRDYELAARDAEAAARAGNPPAAAAARDAMRAAERAIADCDAALEILAQCEHRLVHALNCLRQVPDDLAATYEKPYDLVNAGGKLPYDGDFLDGGGIVTIGR